MKTDMENGAWRTFWTAAACVVAAVAAAVCRAMPTDREISLAKPQVEEVVNHVRSGGRTPAQAADKLTGYYSDAASEAEKYLLIKAAVELYAQGARGYAAEREWARLRREIPGLPDAQAASIAYSAVAFLGPGKAPRMEAFIRVYEEKNRSDEDVEKAKQAVRFARETEDSAAGSRARKSLAEALAGNGQWDEALKIFASLDCYAAKFEISPADAPNCDFMQAGDFWWDYPAEDPWPFRAHAAALYEKAIAAGIVPQGLRRRLLADRIVEARRPRAARPGAADDARPATPAAAAVPPSAPAAPANAAAPSPDAPQDAVGRAAALAAAPLDAELPLYCAIDVSHGPSAARYPVEYFSSQPAGDRLEEFKTVKILLRRVEGGSFQMGGKPKNAGLSSRTVRLDRAFYAGVFEITQKQYELVTGEKPSRRGGDMRPVESVSFKQVRGRKDGKPSKRTFLARLRAKTGLDVDLPTAAQWEYACRAGTTDDRPFRGGEIALSQNARYFLNQDLAVGVENSAQRAVRKPDNRGGYQSAHTAVGSYPPNPWGLYDMIGNVSEMCRDSNGNDVFGDNPVSFSRPGVVCCGGSWRDGRGDRFDSPDVLTSWCKQLVPEAVKKPDLGFRIVFPAPAAR